MHLALFAIPLTIAVRFRIPLVVWGENSAFEYGSAEEAHTGFALDGAWLKTYGVTHGTTAADWIGERADAPRTSRPTSGPSDEELAAAGVRAVFLGYYFPWDPQETYRVARAHGFREDEAPRTGYYDLRRHRRRLHLAPPLDEVVQVRLHAAVRQPVAGDPQRPHHARSRHRDPAQDAATTRRIGTSPRSAASAASPRRLSMRSPSASATRPSGSAGRTARGTFRTS